MIYLAVLYESKTVIHRQDYDKVQTLRTEKTHRINEIRFSVFMNLALVMYDQLETTCRV